MLADYADAKPRIQVVVKISKYCNLRCTYCYEFNELSNKRRMSLENIELMLRHFREAIDAGVIAGVEFIWHGGEPFLIPLQYYAAIGGLQREILPDPETYQNMVQTNLTVLTSRHLEFLKTRQFFHHVGVSFDVFGDQRVDTTGALRNDIIMANLETLIENGIEFGAISVLSRDTYPHARSIQKFWETLGKGFRFLPYHLSTDNQQSQRHGLSGKEQVAAMRQCFLDWLASPSPIRIYPMLEYLAYALDFMAGGVKCVYDPVSNEIIYVANVEGSLSGVGHGEMYGPESTYGNIFATSFTEILASPHRRNTSAQAVARMERYCSACPYFGYCPGHPVADASLEDIAVLEENGCTVRHVVAFMIETLEKSDFAEEMRVRLSGANSTADGPCSILESIEPDRALL